jgi:hypothetical protein
MGGSTIRPVAAFFRPRSSTSRYLRWCHTPNDSIRLVAKWCLLMTVL